MVQLLAFVLVAYAAVAHAEHDAGGCNFSGRWRSSWDSPHGDANSDLYLRSTSFGVQGSYEGGSITADFVAAHTKVRGTWQRTGGFPGVSICTHGAFEMTLHEDLVTHTCRLSGRWNYCEAEPRWSWEATQPF